MSQKVKSVELQLTVFAIIVDLKLSKKKSKSKTQNVRQNVSATKLYRAVSVSQKDKTETRMSYGMWEARVEINTQISSLE